MTAAVARSSAATPHAQTTAQVINYRCLFTHDLRRKQKRWQDGSLKYHTFNKRVMLYDERANFIGDMHYKEPGCPGEGDEVTLDAGILVEIGEGVGVTQTDLAPLFEKDRGVRGGEGERESNGGAGGVRRAGVLSTDARKVLGGRANTPMNAGANGTLFQKKHRSLNALLGTPKGSLGRAVQPISPYEQRRAGQENEDRWDDGLGAKRRKIGANGSPIQPFSISRVGKMIGDSSSTSKNTTLSASTVDAKTRSIKATKNSHHDGQARLVIRDIVDITSDGEGHHASDVTLPSTPPPQIRSSVMSAVEQSRLAAARSQPRRVVPFQRRQSPPPGPPGSPPVSTKNRVKNVQDITDIEFAMREFSSPIHPRAVPAPKTVSKVVIAPELISPPRAVALPKPKTLRLGKSQPRPMLMCQKNIPPKLPAAPVRGSKQAPLELSDEDDEVLVSNAMAGKSKQSVRTASGMEHLGSAGVSRNRNILMPNAAIREDRASSPGFGTLPPREESEVTSRLGKANKFQVKKGKTNYKSKMRDESVTRTLDEVDSRFLGPSTNSKKTKAKATAKQAPKVNEKTPFRRVQSENDATVSHLSDEFDALPSIMEDEPTLETTVKPKAAPKKRGLTSKQPLQRTMSLSTTMQKPKAKIVETPKAPEKSKEIGPWTVEAEDLFEWRPPDWAERAAKRAALAC